MVSVVFPVDLIEVLGERAAAEVGYGDLLVVGQAGALGAEVRMFAKGDGVGGIRIVDGYREAARAVVQKDEGVGDHHHDHSDGDPYQDELADDAVVHYLKGAPSEDGAFALFPLRDGIVVGLVRYVSESPISDLHTPASP